MKPDSILSKVPQIAPLKPQKSALTSLVSDLKAAAKHQATEARKARHAEIKKTAKLAKAMGLSVSAITVSGDGFTVLTSDKPAAVEAAPANPWDEVLHG